MRKAFFLVVLALFLLGLGAPLSAASAGPVGDSRHIQVDSLDRPLKLNGKWLFTRVDDPRNALPEADTTHWKLIRTPGPWKGVYPDAAIFTVGWYRGTFEFAPDMVGQDVVVLIDTYMARMNLYLDGVEVYRRPNDININRYYSIQPVPIRFKVTQTRHLLAIRVNTPLMTGIYQLPFEMHRYSPGDRSLAWHHFRGGELRALIGFVTLFFGLFFLLVFSKTKYPLYLVAAVGSLISVPFAVLPADFLLKVYRPETLLFAHYPGLFGTFFAYLFSQFFYKFTPRINWVFGSVFGVTAIAMGSFAFFQDHVAAFQHVRGVYFLMTLASGLGGFYMVVRGLLEKRPGAGILVFGLGFFLVAGINDLLLALGKIQSAAWMFTGISVYTFAMLWVASNIFANTFLENKRLVKELKGINDTLEELVEERTQQLRRKTHDISAMLQNMPQGILTVVQGGIIHPEYSAYLESIFETKEIAGRGLMDLVFSNTNLGPDTLAQTAAIPGVCIGEDRMNFDFNTHVMVQDLERRMADGRVKYLELLWSPICDEGDTIEKLMICVRDATEVRRLEAEASRQKRELEIIGQILSVSQEKWHEFIDSSTNFVEENTEVIKHTQEKHPEVIARLFRNMHTVKGNARTYGLLHLTNKVHETEQKYDDMRKDPDAAWDPEVMLQHLHETRLLLSEYAQINDHKLGRRGPGRRGSVEKYLMVEKEQILETLHLLEKVDRNDPTALQAAIARTAAVLNLFGTEPIQEVVVGILDSMPSLAAELGKLAPVITIQDRGIVVRSQISGLLKNLFMHLFRNSMDHGIEDAATRVAAGKTPEGHIDLDLSLLPDGQLQMRLKDDGRGLPIAQIRQEALKKQLISEAEATPAEEVAKLIFRSGLSTAERVTEVSGRGVGMDAVKGFLDREGGSIEIHFLDDHATADFRPFEIILILPKSFAVQTAA